MEKTIKGLEELIQEEDKKMEAMKKTASFKTVSEKFSYILGLTKALSMIKQGE